NHFDDDLVLMEKFEAEKVYSVIHFEGKAKNYYVKRFVFENSAIGKKTSIISEENGSKLILISGAAQPIVKVDTLKGKSQTPETVELNLADLIDVKGMKAQGNRLSPNEVKTIELIAEHDDPEDVPDPVPEVSLEEVVRVEKQDQEASKEITPEPEMISADQSPQTADPKRKPIDFEITNPEDVDIDDKGQIGLF
ncbi:MAG TPA: DNA gyrase/topoisomerase IV subunit A, partial [Sphingobacteriaceae bacterium]